MTVTKSLRGTAAAAVLVLGAAACGGDDSDDDSDGATGDTAEESAAGEGGRSGAEPSCEPLAETESVTVTISSTNMAFAAPLLAKEVGAFEEEGLDVTFETLSSQDALAPLGQGRVDVTLSTLNAGVLNAISEGIDIRWIAPLYVANPDANEGLWAQPDLGMTEGELDVTALEGAQVSTPAGEGGTSTYILAEQLLQEDMTLSDLSYQQMGTADILAALEAGNLDLGWLSDPFWQQADGSDLVYVGGFPEAQNGTAMLAGSGLLDRPEAAQAFLRAIQSTIDEHLGEGYLEDPDTVESLSNALDVPAEELENPYPHVFDPQLGLEDAGEFATGMQETFLEMGDLLTYDEPLPADTVVDASIGEAAASCL